MVGDDPTHLSIPVPKTGESSFLHTGINVLKQLDVDSSGRRLRYYVKKQTGYRGYDPLISTLTGWRLHQADSYPIWYFTLSKRFGEPERNIS